jgi:DNA-binding response OmpR family regulator
VTLLKSGLLAYCALVTDINLLGKLTGWLLGKLTGWEVARAAREADPNFPVVYISGAAAHEWPAQGVPNSIMQKPFAPAQLTTAVSQLLNERSAPDLGKA